MKIVVLGPGAMGCLFAGLLAESGQNNIWLFDKSESRAREITENGLKIEGIGDFRSIPDIRATTRTREIGTADLIIVFVKSYDTAEAVRSILPAVGAETTILTLQNGLTNVQAISSIVGAEKVVAGVTSHGATLLGIGYVRHAGVGRTVLGNIGRECSSRIEEIARIFTKAGINATCSENIYGYIWAKLVINAAINPVTALTGLLNGQLLEHEQTRKLMNMSATECLNVAAARRIILPHDAPDVESVCKATAPNVSSMLQDVMHGKRTEIDAINGAVINEARKMGMTVPVNEALTYLVKGLEYRTAGHRTER